MSASARALLLALWALAGCTSRIDLGRELPCDDGGVRCATPGGASRCVLAQSDPANCGACGRVCAAQEQCLLGVCCEGFVWNGACQGGAFEDHLVPNVGDEVLRAQLRDLDGDGVDDAIYFAQLSENLAVLWGSRGASFDPQRRTDLSVGRYGPAQAFGDLDGDGLLDTLFLVQSHGPPLATQLAVVRGSRERSLRVDLRVDLEGDNNGLAVLDADGDGHTDVLVYRSTPACLAILPGDGTGRLGPVRCIAALQPTFDLAWILPLAPDAQGRARLLARSSALRADAMGWSIVTLARGATGIEATTDSDLPLRVDLLGARDLDGDGNPELLLREIDAARRLQSLRLATVDQRGQASQSRPLVVPLPYDGSGIGYAGDLGDFNGDGRLDVAAFSVCGYCPSHAHVLLAR